MATVVDQFIVKYTLDTSDLEKKQKATEKSLRDSNKRIKEDGDKMGDAVEAGSKRAAGSLGIIGSMLGKGGVIGLAIGSLIYAGKAIDDKMFKVAQSLRRLGLDSKNLGIAANEMRNLQYASEMAGGSMEDATNDVGGLSKSLFNLKFNGQVSDSLIMLSRLGVQFTDSYGKARDFGDVMLDVATKIEQAKKAGRMTDAEGYQFALQAGMSGGDANLVNGGVANYKAAMAQQNARRQVQDKDIKGGSRWVQSSTNIGQTVEAEVGNAAMSGYGNTRAAADDALVASGKAAADALKEFGLVVQETTSSWKSWFMSTGGSGRNASTSAGKAQAKEVKDTRSFLEKLLAPAEGGRNASTGNVSRGIRNNNPLNLMARKDKQGNYTDAHDKDGFRVFGSADEGMAEANRQLGLYAAKGNDTLKGIISTWAPNKDKKGKIINDTEAYIKDVSKRTGIGADDKVGPEQRAAVAAAMARHESGYVAPSSPKARAASAASAAAPGASKTDVQIGSITVNTQAKDAHGVAAGLDGAIKRKLLTAHAEGGQS